MDVVNYQRLCMQSSKDMRARQRTFCCCKAPVQMFTEKEEVERQILVYWKARRSGLWVQTHQQGNTEHNILVNEEKKVPGHLIKKETFGWSILVTLLRSFVQTVKTHLNMGVYGEKKNAS